MDQQVVLRSVVHSQQKLPRNDAEALWKENKLVGLFNLPSQEIFNACLDFGIEISDDKDLFSIEEVNNLKKKVLSLQETNGLLLKSLSELRSKVAEMAKEALMKDEKYETQVKCLKNELSNMTKKISKLKKKTTITSPSSPSSSLSTPSSTSTSSPSSTSPLPEELTTSIPPCTTPSTLTPTPRSPQQQQNQREPTTTSESHRKQKGGGWQVQGRRKHKDRDTEQTEEGRNGPKAGRRKQEGERDNNEVSRSEGKDKEQFVDRRTEGRRTQEEEKEKEDKHSLAEDRLWEMVEHNKLLTNELVTLVRENDTLRKELEEARSTDLNRILFQGFINNLGATTSPSPSPSPSASSASSTFLPYPPGLGFGGGGGGGGALGSLASFISPSILRSAATPTASSFSQSRLFQQVVGNGGERSNSGVPREETEEDPEWA